MRIFANVKSSQKPYGLTRNCPRRSICRHLCKKASYDWRFGDGKVPEDRTTGLITLPCGNIVSSIQELTDKVYPNIKHNYSSPEWLCERAILAARNDTV